MRSKSQARFRKREVEWHPSTLTLGGHPCSRSCVIAFVAEGKSTYLFGDLPVDGCASAVLNCATEYYTNPDGSLPWSERPEPLKKGILASIPPLSKWTKLHLHSC